MSDSKEQREWRAQDDARTLAESEVIKADAARLTEAKVAAARLAEEDKERATAMSHVARIRKTRSPEDKGQQGEGGAEGEGGGEAKKPLPKPKSNFNVFSRI